MSGGKTSETSSNTIDPEQMALFKQNYASALNVANRAFQPYTGELAPGSNPALDASLSMFGDIGADRTGASTLGLGLDALKGLGTGDLSAYMNPFQKNVVDTTMAGLERAREMARLSDAQRATAAHAFGGSRHGVADSLTNEAYDRNAASALANLNAQNFTNAQSRALQAGSAFGALSDRELQQALQRAGSLGTAGDRQRSIQEQLDDAKYQEFMRQWMYPEAQQNLRNAALGLIPLQQTTTTTGKTSKNAFSSFLDLLSAAGSGAQGYAALTKK